jgi:hypothetical protein
MSKLLHAGAAIVLFIAARSVAAAPANTPPDCSAIAFRPMLAHTSDGNQDVGLYKSRFGRIEVKATVKGGATQNYFVEINGKPLQAAGALPPVVSVCAKAKRLPAPATPEPACTGDQLQVLNVHSAENRFVLLYAHRAGAWHFCSAGTSGATSSS